MPQALDEFIAMLTKAKIPEETVNYLRDELGVTSCDHFAEFADKKEEVADAFSSDSHKPSRATIATLKGLWRNCEAAVERKVKRKTEGLPCEEMEEPLAPDVQKDIITTFLTFYNLLRIDSRRILSDPQFGRFRRECQLGAPSNYAIMRLKSLAAGQMAAPVKKERLSDFLEFSVAGNYVDTEVKDLASWCNKLQMLCFTYAVVGCFQCTYTDEFGKSVTSMYVHMSDSDAYQYEFTNFVQKLRTRYTGVSVLAYITVCEEQFRGKNHRSRQGVDKVPMGRAMTRVLKEESHIWRTNETELVQRQRNEQRHRSRTPPPPRVPRGKGNGKDGKDKDRRGREATSASSAPIGEKKVKSAEKDSQGKIFCKAFNDRRGCSRRDCDRVHRCDVLMDGNKTCNGNHPRKDHVPSQHGRPIPR